MSPEGAEDSRCRQTLCAAGGRGKGDVVDESGEGAE
jgi:hypothetical protein